MAARDPYPTATPFLPERLTTAALRDAIQRCEGCPLHADATQAVFSEGLADLGLVSETLAHRSRCGRFAACR